MEPTVFNDFCRFLFVLVVSHHHIWTFYENLFVWPEADFDTFYNFTYRAYSKHFRCVNCIHGNDRRCFCKTIPFENGNACAVKKSRQTCLKRRRTRRNRFNTCKTQRLFYFREDKFACHFELKSVQTVAFFFRFPCENDPQSPIKYDGLYAACCTPFCDNPIIKLLKKSRNSRKHNGLSRVEVILDCFKRFSEINTCPHVHVQVVKHPFKNMTNR